MKFNSEFTIEIQKFQGPLSKLLELVKKEKLDINQISLAKVTGDFLEYLSELKKSGDVPHSTLADFLVIASKLLLIKSKILVPSLELEEEEEEEIHNLETQLKIHSRIKEAESKIGDNWNKYPAMASREFLAGREIIFHPGNTALEDLKNALTKIAKEIKKLRPVDKIKREVINLKSKMKDIMKRVSSQPTGFKKFFQSGTRNEITILFLVVLHLFREEKIQFEQKERFGEIKIKKAGK